jgi:hypothetical protein
VQVQLEKHVNGHFNSSDQQSSSKRSSDPPVPKKIKKDQQKKTKVRRQPWSGELREREKKECSHHPEMPTREEECISMET